MSLEAARIERDILASARAEIPTFCRKHFGLLGALRLHWLSFRTDLFLAPINLFLVGPKLALNLVGWVLQSLGLKRLSLFLQRVDMSVPTSLRRRIRADLAHALIDFDHLEASIQLEQRRDWRRRVDRLIEDYLSARDAIAEFSAGLMVLAFGFFALDRLTPGALSLGPILASGIAYEDAVQSFWLGPWAGGLWYGAFGVETPWYWTVGMIAGMIGVVAIMSTVIGIVTDPVQTWLGIHQRRLRRLVDRIERVTKEASDLRLDVKDPYLPRIADVLDVTVSALRLGR